MQRFRNKNIYLVFNQMCSTVRRKLNKNIRNDTQIKLHQAMPVVMPAYGSQIWNIKQKTSGKKLKLRK
jgi:hypothetical protein